MFSIIAAVLFAMRVALTFFLHISIPLSKHVKQYKALIETPPLLPAVALKCKCESTMRS